MVAATILGTQEKAAQRMRQDKVQNHPAFCVCSPSLGDDTSPSQDTEQRGDSPAAAILHLRSGDTYLLPNMIALFKGI